MAQYCHLSQQGTCNAAQEVMLIRSACFDLLFVLILLHNPFSHKACSSSFFCVLSHWAGMHAQCRPRDCPPLVVTKMHVEAASQ